MFALSHLVLVFLGALQADINFHSSSINEALRIYQAYTGADSGYDFFAPDVGTQLRASFEVTDQKGEVQSTVFDNPQDKEISLRIGNIVNMFWSEDYDEDTQRALAASWASAISRRYPAAKKVRLRIQEYDLPTIQEYNEGLRPKWNDYYMATFDLATYRMGDAR